MKKAHEVNDLLFWGVAWVALLVVCVMVGAGFGIAELGFFVWGGLCFAWSVLVTDKAMDRQKAFILRLFGR